MYASAERVVHVYGKEGNSGDLALFKLDLPCSPAEEDPWLPFVLKGALSYCLFV